MVWNRRPRFSWPRSLGLLLCLVSFSSLSVATNQPNERFTCENPEEAVELYRAFPNNVDAEIHHAICQVLKGDREEGLRRLYRVTDKHNYVFSAYFLAEYIEYGGDFKAQVIDKDKIDEAIDAYFKVLFLIDLTPYYPRDYERYEYDGQMELQSHYRVAFLYMRKFILGATGLYREHLFNSPNYEGSKDFSTYPRYSPYTLDSLGKVIKHANRCIALPKKSYFRQPHYDDYQEACLLLKDTAKDFLPLEEKNLDLLALRSCSMDILKCEKHKEVIMESMAPISIKLNKSLKDIFAKYQQESAETTTQ